MTRKFIGKPAVRASIPLWIGLYGPSGAGKTYSALRLADGIRSVVGGKIGVGDTESGRALHYASEFTFDHYPFDPPFDPMSYRALIEQMAADGVTVAIIDSASHEHEGPGGVLEMHDAEVERLAAKWDTSRDAVNASGWIAPKRQRLQMVDAAKRTRMHILWCFRAQDKMDFRSKRPARMGYMPIGGDVLIFEMAMTALLMPGAQGKPTWQGKEAGEKAMIKLPHWARDMLRSGPLSEETGAALARWAQGSEPTDDKPAAKGPDIDGLIAAYRDCDAADFEALENERRDLWPLLAKDAQKALKTASDAAKARVIESNHE